MAFESFVGIEHIVCEKDVEELPPPQITFCRKDFRFRAALEVTSPDLCRVTSRDLCATSSLPMPLGGDAVHPTWGAQTARDIPLNEKFRKSTKSVENHETKSKPSGKGFGCS